MRTACFVISILLAVSAPAHAQTADTGAIAGTVRDASGGVVPDAAITVTSLATRAPRTGATGPKGAYLVSLLPPGAYRVDVAKPGFKTLTFPSVSVIVTETEILNGRLEVGATTEEVAVTAEAEQLQTESSALGHVTNQQMVENLPLVTRNYTQIIGLNPGVAAEVTNASALGRGNGGASFSAGGGSTSSNNYQMDGVAIDDLAGGNQVAIPNPDMIQEFKVQTGQYDATYGRNSGANVNVVTKSGTNQIHGVLFEYLRNEDLNANDFYNNLAHQPRGLLRQNQFGGTAGGAVIKDKLFYFGSYQGTRQINGLGCSTSVVLPPLTDNRSAAALGALFAGQRGSQQVALGNVGPAIAADGSNISPQALALFNYKLPNGQYAIPSPQTINRSKPFASQGFSVFTSPCSFNEDQGMGNADYIQSARSRFAMRFFTANSSTVNSLPASKIGGSTVPGWPLLTPQTYYNASLAHTFILSPSLINQFEAGYHRTSNQQTQAEPMQYSQLGINTPSYDNGIPEIAVNGSLSLGGNGQSVFSFQNTYILQDSMAWMRGRHTIRFGGGVVKAQYNEEGFHFIAGMQFLSFPDMLLGLNATQAGTAAVGVPVGNVNLSVDLPGLGDRAFRTTDGNAYIQDDIKLTRTFTLNIGMRYEREGDLSDKLGRNGNFNYNLANPNPPAAGTLAGFVIPSNYPTATFGAPPAGVAQADNSLGISGIGQNTWNPRLGFAWQLPGSQRFVLRGGYGLYHDRTTGQPFVQLLTAPPFAKIQQLSATQNGNATIANPFPAAVTLPVFPPYSPTTSQTVTIIDPTYRAPTSQIYSMGLQTKLVHDTVLSVSYQGMRGTHLLEQLSINQANIASSSNPIRGLTTNTVANIPLRVPYQGFTASGMKDVESAAESWYNALDVSLEKRMSHGLQFMAAYTYARSFSTANNAVNGSSGAVPLGNQNSRSQGYGPDPFIRDQRFVLSSFYALPFFMHGNSLAQKTLGGWRLAGVLTIQSGQRLTPTINTSTNIFGMTSDRPQMAVGCTYPQLATSGSTVSRLSSYFNQSCMTTPPVIGDDGRGTTFGNAGIGIVRGPGQANTDLSLMKQFGIPRWERARLEFRAEFFNAFNHAQFANPNLTFGSASFGQILATSVNPRVIQFALRFSF